MASRPNMVTEHLTSRFVRPDMDVELSENALTVLRKRYLLEGETPAELFWRVAVNVALAEEHYDRTTPDESVQKAADEFYGLMTRLEFLPNSPTLMNAGRELGQYFACFVLPVEDSLTRSEDDGIFDSVRSAALIQKTGGGTGFSFSRLRPEGAALQSTHGKTSGPVSFMRVFNAATEAIHQGGFRRGANMGVLRVDHPDILDFIRLKSDPGEMTNFNLSVAVTDAFIKSVDTKQVHEVVDPSSNERTPLRAKIRDDLGGVTGYEDKEWTGLDVLDLIARTAHATGEPGVLFHDRINRDNVTPVLGDMEATNPCGEQPLLPWEACNLGSINVSAFVEKKKFQWTRLEQAVKTAVRFLDNVIDVNRYPKAPIEKIVRENRKIGLGIMGWADALFKMGLRYDGKEARDLARRLMKTVREEGWKASIELAKVRGPFPNFDVSLMRTAKKDHPYFPEFYRKDREPMRNATITTIAPTGTISILAGVSGGIEPLYALAFHRQILNGETLLEVHPHFRRIAELEDFYRPEIIDRILQEGTIRNIEEIPEKYRNLFVCAYDVSPEAHLQMQAAFQEHTDNAVSKTVNFPADASAEDIRKVYELALELGVKGVTVYRDGTRDRQPMALAEARCPECGTPLPNEGGCAIETCACGYSRCS